MGGRREVDDSPVPPAAAGRSIGIVDGDGEALRAGRGVFPGQFRRGVAAFAAEALEHFAAAQRLAVGNVATSEGEVGGLGCEAQAEGEGSKEKSGFHAYLVLVGEEIRVY